MKKKRILLTILSIVLLFTMHNPVAYAQEENTTEEDRTFAPYFYVENADASTDSFPLKETNVTTNISGVIADTYVTQVYANEGETPISARYVFPASTKVSVHGMKMTVGNQIVTAKIKEKEEAKEEYDKAQSEGKTASLLEQQNPNVFTMDIANIMPGDTISIELHYTEFINPVEGTYQFIFPTVVGPRYAAPANRDDDSVNTDEWIASPYLAEGSTVTGKYNINVNLSTGVPITGLTSKSHKINIDWDDNSVAHVSLSDPKAFAGNRDFILDYKLTSQDISSGLALSTGENENFFMLTVQPPERYETTDIPEREYIFVLDVSGSMNGYPLDTAKELISNLVSNLRETDSFNLILFSGDAALLSESSLPATSRNIRKAMRLIDNQEGYGGTNLSTAVETALKLPSTEDVSRSIVIITDGYVSGETDTFDLIQENLGAASVFPFGIGTSVNRYLIEGIAAAGQGEAFIVTDKEDATETAERFRTYITSPILTNMQITYDGFDVYDVEAGTLSTLYAQKPIIVFGKWRGEPSGTIRLTGKTGKKDYTLEIPVAEASTSSDNSALPYLWARKRLERLTDYGTYKDNPDIKEEVTQLGLTYNMLTSYTSFIAVLDVVRNDTGNSTNVDQPNPLPLQVSNLAVGGGYKIGSEPKDIILLIGVTGIVCLRLVRNKKQKLANKHNI